MVYRLVNGKSADVLLNSMSEDKGTMMQGFVTPDAQLGALRA